MIAAAAMPRRLFWLAMGGASAAATRAECRSNGEPKRSQNGRFCRLPEIGDIGAQDNNRQAHRAGSNNSEPTDLIGMPLQIGLSNIQLSYFRSPNSIVLRNAIGTGVV